MVTHSQSDAEHAHRIVNLLDGQVVSEKQVGRITKVENELAEAV